MASNLIGFVLGMILVRRTMGLVRVWRHTAAICADPPFGGAETEVQDGAESPDFCGLLEGDLYPEGRSSE